MTSSTSPFDPQVIADREAARRERIQARPGAAADNEAFTTVAEPEVFTIRQGPLSTHIETSSAEAADHAWRHRHQLLAMFPAPELRIHCTDHRSATALSMTFKPQPA